MLPSGLGGESGMGERKLESLDDLVYHATDDEGIVLDAPTLAEVCAAIRKLKNGKASGSDGIYNCRVVKAFYFLHCSSATGSFPESVEHR